jgi:ADYC domain
MTKRKYPTPLMLAVGAAAMLAATPTARAKPCDSCGTNAATVGDGIVFDELSVKKGDGKPSGPKLRGARLLSTGAPVELRVHGDELFAVGGGITLQGGALTDVIIALEMTDGRAYELKLDGFNDHFRFWAEPNGLVPAYIFKVRKTGLKKSARPVPRGRTPNYAPDVIPLEENFVRHLCTGEHPEPTLNPQKDQEFLAFVFEGDHYTSGHAVTAQAAGRFNLACFGTAAAKMHLLRHTQAGSAPGSRPTTLDQRTAMLRAITADYCGDGRSWTADGTPLWWTDKQQLFPLQSQPDFVKLPDGAFSRQIEAVWGPKGRLLCLNEPRRSPVTASAPCTAPGVLRADITTGAQSCANLSRIARCDALAWPKRAKNPFSDAPLTPNPLKPTAALANAEVITVNRAGGDPHCEGIAWSNQSQ